MRRTCEFGRLLGTAEHSIPFTRDPCKNCDGILKIVSNIERFRDINNCERKESKLIVSTGTVAVVSIAIDELLGCEGIH